MSHSTYEYVTSHITSHTNESRHIWTPSILISRHLCVYESWHVWMSHGTYKWVMSHTNKSYHIEVPVIIILRHAYMSHGTYEWVLTHMNESFHTRMSHATLKYRQSSFYDTSKIPHQSIALYVRVCACVCVCMYEHEYVYVCICMYMCRCIYVYMRIYMYIYICTYICMHHDNKIPHLSIALYECVCAWVCVYRYEYGYMYVCMYTCSWVSKDARGASPLPLPPPPPPQKHTHPQPHLGYCRGACRGGERGSWCDESYTGLFPKKYPTTQGSFWGKTPITHGSFATADTRLFCCTPGHRAYLWYENRACGGVKRVTVCWGPKHKALCIKVLYNIHFMTGRNPRKSLDPFTPERASTPLSPLLHPKALSVKRVCLIVVPQSNAPAPTYRACEYDYDYDYDYDSHIITMCCAVLCCDVMCVCVCECVCVWCYVLCCDGM